MPSQSQIVGTIWVCTDCMHLHCNGEFSPDRPEDLPEPLSQVTEYDLTAGMLAEEHHEECEVRLTGAWPTNYECDCETRSHSTTSCEGCGDYNHGERHVLTLWTKDN